MPRRKNKQTDVTECTIDDSFDSLIIKRTDYPSHIWISFELHQLYRNENGQQSRKSILEKPKLHFGKDLVVMHIQACASLACFKDHIQGCAILTCFKDHMPAYLRLLECDDDDQYVDTVITKNYIRSVVITQAK